MPFIPFLPRPFWIGVVAAPLVGMVVKPIFREAVKASVSVGLQVTKATAEAREEFEDLTAEARAESRATPTKRRSEVV